MNMSKIMLGDTGPIADNRSFPIHLPLVGAMTDIMLVAVNGAGNPVAYGNEIVDVSFTAGSISIIPPMSPADLVADMRYNNGATGYVANNAIIPFPLELPNIVSEHDAVPYLIGTKGIPSLTITVRFSALANVAGVQAWARHFTGTHLMSTNSGVRAVNMDEMGLGRHIRFARETETDAVVGKKVFRKYPNVGEADVGLLYTTIVNGVGAVKTLKVENNYETKEDIPYAIEAHWQREAGRTPQAGYSTFDESLGNSASAFKPLGEAKSLKATTNFSVAPAGGRFDVIIKTIHGIDPKLGG